MKRAGQWCNIVDGYFGFIFQGNVAHLASEWMRKNMCADAQTRVVNIVPKIKGMTTGYEAHTHPLPR